MATDVPMAETEDPTELVSCGKCNTVNTVPYGLDKFMCYNCNVMVAISRERSAACAAASTAARHLEEVPGSSVQATVPTTSEQPRRTGEGGAAGFLGKLQKTMDKSFQKVKKTIEGLDDSGASNGGARPLPPRATVGPPSELTVEDQQLQWALDASLREAHAQNSTQTPQNDSRQPSSPAVSSSPGYDHRRHLIETLADQLAEGSAGDQLQAAAAEAARRLRAVEQHARRAEADLAAAKEREASAVSARAVLERQLQDNEALIQGLTSQLDNLHAQLSEKNTRVAALERALVVARDAAALAATEVGGQQGMDDLENQGVIAQLLERIAQLESNMLRATHFAPEPGEEAALVAKAQAAAEEPAAPAEAKEALVTKAQGSASAEEPAALAETKAAPAANVESVTEEAVPLEQVKKEEKVEEVAAMPFSPPPRTSAVEPAAASGTAVDVMAAPAEAGKEAVLAAKTETAVEGPAVSADTEAAAPSKAELTEKESSEVNADEEATASTDDKDESGDKQAQELASTKEATSTTDASVAP